MTPQMNRLLPTLALVAVVAAGCRGQAFSDPPIHLQQNMDQQDRFDAQEPNEFFEDGRAARAYVEGTEPASRVDGSVTGQALDCVLEWNDEHRCTGMVDGEDGAKVPAETLPEGISANFPEGQVSMDFLQRGRERFEIYCAPCHGVAGDGQGPVADRYPAEAVVPKNLHLQALREMPLGQLYGVVANGKGSMPSYAKQIPVDDRWAIAAYVRVLQLSQSEKE